GARGDALGRAPRPRPRLRPRDDEADAGERARDVARPGHRGRGAGAGHLHGAPRLPHGVRRRQGQAPPDLRGGGALRSPGDRPPMSRRISISSQDLTPFFGPSYAPLAAHLTAETLAP